METMENKLNGGLVWAFALGALLLGVGSGYLTTGLSWKVSSGIYFGIFAVAGFASLALTRARTATGVIAFLLAAVASAVFYYLIVRYAVSVVTDATVQAGGGDAAARQQASQAAGTFGNLFGVMVAGINLIATAVAGVGGCIAGARFRAQGGVRRLFAEAR